MESLFTEYLTNIQADIATIQGCESENILTLIGIISAMSVAFISQHKVETAGFLLQFAEAI